MDIQTIKLGNLLRNRQSALWQAVSYCAIKYSLVLEYVVTRAMNVCVWCCVLSTQILSQHFGRLFQLPKVIEGLVDILLHGQPVSEGRWVGAHCSLWGMSCTSCRVAALVTFFTSMMCWKLQVHLLYVHCSVLELFKGMSTGVKV